MKTQGKNYISNFFWFAKSQEIIFRCGKWIEAPLKKGRFSLISKTLVTLWIFHLKNSNNNIISI